MKNKTVSAIFTNAALSFLLSLGGILCLTTAFEIEISRTVLAAHCCVWSLGSCFLLTRPRGGWLILLGAFLLYALRLWYKTDLVDQILQLCYNISRMFASAYGFGWLGKPTGVESVALPLYLWGSITALVTGWSITKGRFTAVAVLFSLLPLALCLVLTDTIPAFGWLFMLLFALILLLLTQRVRRQNKAQAVSLTWMLALPVAMALLLLFVANPRATYNKQHYADKLGDSLLRAVDRLPYIDIEADGALRFNPVRHIPDTVDLSDKGPNNQLRIPVMEVTAEASGSLYLRGRHYDCYTGAQWTVSEHQAETFTTLTTVPYSAYGLMPQNNGTLTIKTSGIRSSRYLPYYPDMAYPLEQGTCANPGQETTYSYNWYSLPAGFESAVSDQPFTDFGFLSSSFSTPIVINEESYFNDNDYVFYSYARPVTPYAHYLELPEDTRLWAEAYLEAQLPQLSEAGNVCDIAGAIAGLVRTSADYDLDTPRMPEDRTDFARWFLEESDTGYCVHYATATTVLLRAAGIPARYVEGYLAEAVAGRTVSVTEKDAHAWAEYFVVGIGWIPLESTSGTLNSDISVPGTSAATTQPDDTTAPAPSVTEDPTDPPEPSESTAAPSRPAPVPTDTTAGAPSQEATDPTVPAPVEKEPFTVSKPAVIGFCLFLLLLGQYPLRLSLQEKYLRAGSPNRRAVKYWRFARRLAQLSHQPLPDELEELALRAKFSQHTLTEADLAPFDAFRAETLRQLKESPWWLKLYHRFIRAAY